MQLHAVRLASLSSLVLQRKADVLFWVACLLVWLSSPPLQPMPSISSMIARPEQKDLILSMKHVTLTCHRAYAMVSSRLVQTLA